ncbi:MAG TPA: hypothetical protein VMW64_05490 [Dehalococcoidia bacterium]|nr:hypothetical protein [Dehalococcoidia bacterium]
MSQNIDLKQIERKAYTSYFQDGFWDIFMGLLMLGMGINIAFESTIWYGVVLAIAVLIVTVGRKLITEPRIGRVKFGPARKVKQWAIIVVLTISFLFGIGMFVASYYGADIPRELMATIAGVWFCIVFSLMAYFMDFSRLFVYGLLLSASFAIAIAYSDTITIIVFFASAAIALPIGLVMLTRFLRRYPRLPKENIDAGS